MILVVTEYGELQQEPRPATALKQFLEHSLADAGYSASLYITRTRRGDRFLVSSVRHSGKLLKERADWERFEALLKVFVEQLGAKYSLQD